MLKELSVSLQKTNLKNYLLIAVAVHNSSDSPALSIMAPGASSAIVNIVDVDIFYQGQDH